MVLNLDLAPTLLDLAGLPVPPRMEGASLRPLLADQPCGVDQPPGRVVDRPLLTGEPCEWRGAWLYEYFKDFPYNVPEIRAVRTERHVYVEYGGSKGPELFDLARDPRQHANLYGTPEGKGLAAALKESLNRLEKGEQP